MISLGVIGLRKASATADLCRPRLIQVTSLSSCIMQLVSLWS
jgi:hypothetical protein